jgi:hypothetical protein
MIKPTHFMTVAILSALAGAPTLARAGTDIRTYPLPYTISTNHNYGPGAVPGTFAYYDGPAHKCERSSAAYPGQDRRRHPCN